MAFADAERQAARYKCGRQEVNLNTRGWKVCHIDAIGIKKPGAVNNLPIGTLTDHFRRLMTPSNMFLVPKIWSGLGEMPEMIEAAKAVR
jgi:hypothetical protein